MRRTAALLVVVAPMLAIAAGAELTVEDYWAVNKARLELAATDWQERITAAQDAKGDKQKLLASIQSITKASASRHDQLHVKLGVTQRQYLHFPSEHAAAIESYLEEYPDFKREIDVLRQNVHALMETFDSIADPILNGGER